MIHFLPADLPALGSKWLRPLILCGQRSLAVFCSGVFLSFAAHWILVQVSGGVLAQMLVSVAGIVLLVGIAWLATWYRSLPKLFEVPEIALAGSAEPSAKTIIQPRPA